MKKLVVVFAAILLTTTAFTQSGKSEKMERMKAERIAFITEELSLTSEEAQVFWPVFNEYSEKKFSLKKEVRQLKQELKNSIETESGGEAELFEKILNKEEEEIQLKRIYHKKFLKTLPEAKVYQLYLAEVKFKRYLLKKLREKRG